VRRRWEDPVKLGKKPHTPDARDLRFATYRTTALPPLPATWGYDGASIGIPVDGWGMLGNDQWGDCVWAGACHEHILDTRVAGTPATFTDADALGAYSAVTGFNPAAGPSGSNPTDQGTDVRTALKYRQKTGIRDAAGRVHKIAAYLALDVDRLKSGDFTEVDEAAYLFGQVGLGIEFPDSAMTQFNERKEWSYVAGSQVDGGHYIPLVAKRKHLEIVTWGRVVACTQAFFEHYLDEAWAIITADWLDAAGKSPQGFDLAQLDADLAAL
jgi:hypothetical protein